MNTLLKNGKKIHEMRPVKKSVWDADYSSDSMWQIKWCNYA